MNKETFNKAKTIYTNIECIEDMLEAIRLGSYIQLRHNDKEYRLRKDVVGDKVISELEIVIKHHLLVRLSELQTELNNL